MWKLMLEEVGDVRGILDYILNISQHWNGLKGWIIGVGVKYQSTFWEWNNEDQKGQFRVL